MSQYRLAPLNALRAFEAAARHLSFTRAARELNVTPAAVGHQVKALEDHLGVALFRRLNRALVLTEAGQAGLPDLQAGFRRLADGVEHIRARETGGQLTVTADPDFAARWLVRRMDRFRALHPEIEIRLDASVRVVDLAREGVDVGIRYGGGNWKGVRAQRLYADDIFPVCSPCLLHGEHPLRVPADLRWHTLLHEGWGGDEEDYSWRMWLRAAGCEELAETVRGPRFAQHNLLIEAAIEGQGVALTTSALVADELANARLVRLFGGSGILPTEFGYYIVYPREAAARPKVQAFRDWLLAEVAAGPLAARPRPAEGAR